MLYIGLFLFLLVLLFLSSYLLTQALSKLFYRITRNQKWTIMMLALLFFPGVLIHELAHFLMASVLLVPTGEIEFIPQIMEDRVKLGSVQVGQTDPFRRALIGIAPVIAGASVLVGILYYAMTIPFPYSSFDSVKMIGILYVLFEVSNTMFSSKRDVEGTLELLVAVSLIGIILFIAGVRIPESVFAFLNSAKIIFFFQQVSIMLLFPLILNYLLWGVSKLFVKR